MIVDGFPQIIKIVFFQILNFFNGLTDIIRYALFILNIIVAMI